MIRRDITMNDKEMIHNSARLFKILGDETRLSILHLLSKAEANVSTIVNHIGIEQSNASHQLKILKDHRLIQSRREGKSVVYFPDDNHIYEILDQVFAHIKEDTDTE
ncbi:ArsR/SmtB family transcription factor [Virgibacillus chiguensis]|nr:metalloregulator ArsR/SmtB family transcription factor [Virgibacillus chiguensis]